jgi:cytochrome c biogenesis protein CcdA
MAASNIFRRLLGALGYALVCGAGWFACALTVFAAQQVVGIASASDS